MDKLPEFLKQGPALTDRRRRQLEGIMKSWGQVFHTMKMLRSLPLEDELSDLRFMMMYELENEKRLLILTRLLGRYKMVLGEIYHQQIFECAK